MVFGVLSIYFAIAIYFNSLGVILIVLLFVSLIVTYIKLVEEKRLLDDFGNEYNTYRENTPMIIPCPWTRKLKR